MKTYQQPYDKPCNDHDENIQQNQRPHIEDSHHHLVYNLVPYLVSTD